MLNQSNNATSKCDLMISQTFIRFEKTLECLELQALATMTLLTLRLIQSTWSFALLFNINTFEISGYVINRQNSA